MSIEQMSIVLHHSEARGTDKLILLGIANHDGDGGSWPSIATLARYGNVTVRGAQKAIDRLIQLGELKRDIQAGGLAGLAEHLRPNRYEVAVSCPPECDRSAQHRLVDPVNRSSPVPGEPGFTPPVNRSSPPPVNPGSPEPSLEKPSLETPLVQESLEVELDSPSSLAKPKRTAKPLPPDWTPTPEHRSFAAKHGLDLDLEIVKFRGHAEANDRRQRSWNGAFATWLGNAVTYAQRAGGSGYDRRQPEPPSSGFWRYQNVRCDGCGDWLRIDTATSEPTEPHRCRRTLG